MSLAFLVYTVPSFAHQVWAASTTTVTITGYNAPTGKTLGNGIGAFIIPIAVLGIFVGIPTGLGLKGRPVTLIMKFSLLIGMLFSMLSLTAANNLVTPIALPIVAAVFLITYLWKGV